MTVVLAGFAESLAAVEAIWSLLDNGVEVHAFTRRGARVPVAHDPRVRVHPVSSPERDVRRTVAEVQSLAERLGRPVLLALDDAALWVIDNVKAAAPHLDVAGPTGEQARLALDKRLQIEAATRAGFDVPPTAVRSAGQTDPPDFAPPWIVKPALALDERDGRLVKGDAVYVRTLSGLREVLAAREDIVLVQPVFQGVGQGVFGHASEGKVRHWSGHRRIRMMNPAGSGASACMSVDPDPAASDAAGRMMEHADWRGLFMVELLVDGDGRAWFMELNGRPWGSTVLAVRRGLLYPLWTVWQVTTPARVPDVVVPGVHVTARHVGRELLHLVFVIRAAGARRRGRGVPPVATPTVRAALGDVLRWRRGEIAYNYRRGRGRVTVAETWSTLADKLLPGPR